MLLLGLASGMHCVGMCGGVVTAFSAQPIGFVRTGFPRDPATHPVWTRQLAYNAGRISSYAAAGAIAGLVGSLGAQIEGVLPGQIVLYVLANAMLVIVGLHLAGVRSPFALVESLGAPLWRRLAPHASRLLHAQDPQRALLAGAIWGWLPCGLVYGALATATLAGGAGGGALAMAAFGLGTLPWLLAVGVGAARMRALFAQARWRFAAGMLVLGSGVFGMARASGLAEVIQRQVLCL